MLAEEGLKADCNILKHSSSLCQHFSTVGKMYHCFKRGRGIHVKSSSLKNVLLRDDWPYGKLLQTCVQEMYWNEEQKEANFYIADKGGIPV